MPTVSQLIGRGRKTITDKSTTSTLNECSQRRGVYTVIKATTPKESNSALGKIVRVRLIDGFEVTAYIGGVGHNLQGHGVVLIRSGRVEDLPGVRYHIIRGAFGCAGVTNRMQGRSKYGAKKPKAKKQSKS